MNKRKYDKLISYYTKAIDNMTYDPIFGHSIIMEYLVKLDFFRSRRRFKKLNRRFIGKKNYSPTYFQTKLRERFEEEVGQMYHKKARELRDIRKYE